MESVKRTDNVVDGEDARATLLVPPLVAAPEALLLSRRQFQGLLEYEWLSAVDQLHSSPGGCRVDRHAAFCGRRKEHIVISKWSFAGLFESRVVE